MTLRSDLARELSPEEADANMVELDGEIEDRLKSKVMVAGESVVTNLVVISQADYDTHANIDATTLYIILEVV